MRQLTASSSKGVQPQLEAYKTCSQCRAHRHLEYLVVRVARLTERSDIRVSHLVGMPAQPSSHMGPVPRVVQPLGWRPCALQDPAFLARRVPPPLTASPCCCMDHSRRRSPPRVVHLQAIRVSAAATSNLHATQHLIPKYQRKLYSPDKHLGRRNLHAKRISDPIDDIESHTDVYARPRSPGLRAPRLATRPRPQTQTWSGESVSFSMKPSVDPKLPVDRRRTPVGEYRLGNVVAKYRRRDRAVSVGSEHTLVQFRGEGPEQLPLADTPM